MCKIFWLKALQLSKSCCNRTSISFFLPCELTTILSYSSIKMEEIRESTEEFLKIASKHVNIFLKDLQYF